MIKVLKFNEFFSLMKVLKIFLKEVNLVFYPSGKMEIVQLAETRTFCFLSELHGIIEKDEEREEMKMKINIDQILKVCKVLTNVDGIYFTPASEYLQITATKNGKKIRHKVNLLEYFDDVDVVSQIKKSSSVKSDLSATFTPYQLSEINENLALYDDKIIVEFNTDQVTLSSKSLAGSCSYEFTEDCDGIETIDFGKGKFRALYDNSLFQNICKISKILAIDYIDLEYRSTGVMYCVFTLSNNDYVKVIISPYEDVEDEEELSDDEPEEESEEESEEEKGDE